MVVSGGNKPPSTVHHPPSTIHELAMMSMDIAAVSAAPQPDSPCASADTPAGASDVFAALLDEAAGTTGGPSVPSSAVDENDADEDDAFDEMAALAMTSLLSLPTPIVDPVEDDEVAAIEIGDGEKSDDGAIADLTSSTTFVDASIQPQLAPVITEVTGGSDTANDVPASAPVDGPSISPAWNANVLTAAQSEASEKAAADDAVPPVADRKTTSATASATVTDAKNTDDVPTETSVTKIDSDAPPTAKSARASKPSRIDGRKATQAHGKVAQAITAAIDASKTAEAGLHARAMPVAQPAKDVQAPTSVAARFARAIERAAALTRNESASDATMSAGTHSGSGQQSAFSDESTDRTMQPFVALRQAATGMSFTVAAPTPIDMRTLTRSIDAASQAIEHAPATIPERDVVAQLVQSLRVQFRDGIGEAVVKLKPEHLGSVQISLKIENGSIKATVQAEVAAVRQWLESQQDTLRTSLAEQGLRLERFVVEPDGERRASGDDAQPREQRRRQQQRQMSGKDQPVFEVTV